MLKPRSFVLGTSVLLMQTLASPLVSPPAVAAPAFEKMGNFIGRGGARGSAVGPGPDGKEWLYVSYTYLSSIDIVGYKPGSDEYKVWSNGEGGAFAGITGPDGRVYFGTYYNGHVLRLDPVKGVLDDLGQAIPGETYIWNFSQGPDGAIYGGTYPGCKLFRIEPATGAITNLGRLDQTQQYLRTIQAAPDGWVYGTAGPEKANLVGYNIATKEIRSLIPEEKRVPAPGFPPLILGKDGVYSTLGGVSYRLKDGAATVVSAEEVPKAPPANVMKNGEPFPAPKPYPGRSLPLFRLGNGPDGQIYGSSVLPEYFLRFNPRTKERETLGLIPGAQAYGLLSAHNKLYITSYGDATLQIYDPSKPFSPGSKLTNNPSYYGTTAPNQSRPVDVALGGDGRVYIADVPTYGMYGGVLAWYDPQLDKVDSAPVPVKDQSVTAVCAVPTPNDPRTFGDFVLVGTSTAGGSGTTEIRTKEAVLYLWNTRTKAVEWQGVPLPGAQTVSNLAAGGDGLIYGSTTVKQADDSQPSELFAFDPRTRTVVGRTKLEQGAVIRAGLHVLSDGRVVAIAGKSALLVKFAGGKWDLREFATNDVTLNAGKADADGYLYVCADNELVRAKIPAP